MRNVVTVLQREYLQRVRTRSFVVGTIAVPVILFAGVGISTVVESRQSRGEREIVLLDHTGTLAESLIPRLEGEGFVVEEIGPEGEAEARRRVVDGELIAILEVDDATLERGAARWIGRESPSALRSLNVRQVVVRSALEVRLGGREVAGEVSALLEGGALDVVRAEGEEEEEGGREEIAMALGFAGAFLLYMTLIVYGTMVLRAVMEEKTGRIVEVIISSMEPWELMLGKIIGVGAVGLTQLFAWFLTALLLVVSGGLALLPFLADVNLVGQLDEFVPAIGIGLFFILCFLLGYFIYAALFAAVGAVCSTEEEAQQLQVPIIILIVIPFISMMPILQDPDSTVAVILSLVPFFSPILMFARVAAGAAALWEIALSILLMSGAVVVLARIAGRIYTVGILMQGKRPTLPELWRWL